VLWLFVALSVVVVVVIGLVAVGRVTFSLAEHPRSSRYDLDEAVELVADNLPDEVTAQLSYEDVRAILGLHLDYLEVKGVARTISPPLGTVTADAESDTETESDNGTEELAAALGEVMEATPGDEPKEYVFPAWPDAAERGPLVADDDEALPYILGRLGDMGHDVDDVHVVQVLEVERHYLEAIGAIGSEVPSPDDPLASA